MAYENHWLPAFNFNVEERDTSGQNYETLAICRTLAPGPRHVRGCDREEACRVLNRTQ
jgi:hypothetical protein